MGKYDDWDGDDDMTNEKLRNLARDANKEVEKSSKYMHYACISGLFLPTERDNTPKAKKLPSGVYEVGRIPMSDKIFLSPITIVSDDIIEMNESATAQIIKDVELFMSDELKDKYKKFGLLHKRGAILEGVPGGGKSICLTQIAREVIKKYDAAVLFNPSVSSTIEALRVIKDIEPNKPILVMYEEFDSMMGGGEESALLTLLDGQISIPGVYFLCTTNYISKIPSRMKNRPSRFALVVTVDKPTKADREKYIRSKLPDETETLIASIVDNSKDMVIDQIKDLIISVCVFGYGLSDAVRKIKSMQQDEVGYDDYNESNAKNVFKSLVEVDKKPLRPL